MAARKSILAHPVPRYGTLALFLIGGIYLHTIDLHLFTERTGAFVSASTFGAYSFYLLLGCVRGFTLFPLILLIGVGTLFLPPIPLFILTMIGALISSACIYYFSASFKFYERLQRTKGTQLATMERHLKNYELPIIIAWSFVPVLPTDIVCCVSGVMRINILKLLLGVLIGEGLCSVLCIFGSYRLLQFILAGT